MSPHFFFWPFDIGRSKLESERTRAPVHIADSLRVGVLAGDEGAELRMEGHLMACDACRETAISLWERAREMTDPPTPHEPSECLQTRNALMRHLEGGRPLEEVAATHLRGCTACGEVFIEPAKAAHTLAVDEGAVAAQD